MDNLILFQIKTISLLNYKFKHTTSMSIQIISIYVTVCVLYLTL